MPMTEEQFKLGARLTGIEYMIMDLSTKIHRLIGSSPEAIHRSHDHAKAMFAKTGIPGIDPAQSDAFVGEVEITVLRILSGIEEMTGARRT